MRRRSKKKAPKTPPAKTFPCRCPGKGADEKPNTEGDVKGMPVSGGQEDGEGGVIELHTCDGCGCTFGLEMKSPVRTEFDGLTADEERNMRLRAEARAREQR